MVITLRANDFVRKGEAVFDVFREGNEFRQIRVACLSPQSRQEDDVCRTAAE